MLRTKVVTSTVNWAHAQAELHTGAMQPCEEPDEKERQKRGRGWLELA